MSLGRISELRAIATARHGTKILLKPTTQKLHTHWPSRFELQPTSLKQRKNGANHNNNHNSATTNEQNAGKELQKIWCCCFTLGVVNHRTDSDNFHHRVTTSQQPQQQHFLSTFVNTIKRRWLGKSLNSFRPFRLINSSTTRIPTFRPSWRFQVDNLFSLNVPLLWPEKCLFVGT